MEPKIIEVCKIAERMQAVSAVIVERVLGIPRATAAYRLSMAVKRGLMVTCSHSTPRLYDVVPDWREIAGNDAEPQARTKTEEACAAVQGLGIAGAADVGKVVGTDSNLASVRLKNALKKGWLKLAQQGKVNLYSVTPEWLAHVAGDEELCAMPKKAPEPEIDGDDLRIDYTHPPLPQTPRSHWAGLELCRLGARA